jgi:hypothetical protein
MNFVDVEERERTYHYSDGGKVSIKNVACISVSDSGHHRITTKDDTKYIIAPGWRYVELDMDEWTF